MAVRTNVVGAFEVLSPRQEVRATPYAIHATTAGSAATVTALPPNIVQTPALADGSVTVAKIAAGQVVKSLNGLTDAVTLQAVTNVTITPSGNGLLIHATGAGGGLVLPFAGTTASPNPAFVANNTGAGNGVQADTAPRTRAISRLLRPSPAAKPGCTGFSPGL